RALRRWAHAGSGLWPLAVSDLQGRCTHAPRFVPNARARIAIDGGCRKRLIALALAVATSGCSFLVDADGLTDASSDDDAGKRTGSDNASSEDPAPSAPPDVSIGSPP